MKTIFWDEETARIRDAIREHFPDVDERVRQTLCLAEEVGEFVGASRRFLDMARRPGSRDEVVTECADVIITALITALVFDFDIWSAVDDKLAVIQTRGYRQPRTDRDEFLPSGDDHLSSGDRRDDEPDFYADEHTEND